VPFKATARMKHRPDRHARDGRYDKSTTFALRITTTTAGTPSYPSVIPFPPHTQRNERKESEVCHLGGVTEKNHYSCHSG